MQIVEYNRITLEEREKIYLLKNKGLKNIEIARLLGRNRSSIGNELKRCEDDPLGYMPDRAHAQYRKLLSRNKALFLDNNLRDLVVRQLTIDRWSPEQISGRLKMENSELYACTETIYQFIYSPEGIKLNLPSFLRFKRKKRGMRFSRKSRKSNIPDLVSIHTRPEEINERQEYGHWEGDLVIFSTIYSRNITTMVERKSRFVKILLNENKTSNEVIDRIKKTISTMPTAFKSITFDRGSEFTYHAKLPAKTYFCDPRSPWQKGAVENTNSRIRNLLPKRVRPLLLKQNYLDLISNLMNNTPRKSLGFKTPAELFYSNLSQPPITLLR